MKILIKLYMFNQLHVLLNGCSGYSLVDGVEWEGWEEGIQLGGKDDKDLN